MMIDPSDVPEGVDPGRLEQIDREAGELVGICNRVMAQLYIEHSPSITEFAARMIAVNSTESTGVPNVELMTDLGMALTMFPNATQAVVGIIQVALRVGMEAQKQGMTFAECFCDNHDEAREAQAAYIRRLTSGLN